MSKTIRVGTMPGRITEVAVEKGTSIEEVLNIAELDASGYDIKVDGNKVEGSATVDDNTELVLLVKQVKGNAGGQVRVGTMPGRIQEYAVEVGTSISDVLDQAGLDSSGYDVKVDGNKVDPSSETVNDSTELILLVKQVKGN